MNALKKYPNLLWGALIFLLAFLQYANTLGHDYAWDDVIVITENSRVQRGLSSIPEHFQFRSRVNLEDFTGYRPVTMSSFSLDQAVAGMNPGFGHLVNALLFALCAVILFFTLRRLLPRHHAVFSFLVTLVFIVHPIHVEAVANIKSRDEILSLLFGLGAWNLYLKHHDTGKWLSLLGTSVLLLLAIWSKEQAVLFFVFLPLSVWFLRDGNWRDKLGSLLKVPAMFLAIGLVYWLVSSAVVGTPSGFTPVGYIEHPIMGNSYAEEIGLPIKMANKTRLFFLHIQKFLVPHPLVYFSGYNQVPILYFSENPVGLILPVLLALGWLFVTVRLWLRKHMPVIVFGSLFVFVGIFFYLHILIFLWDTMADRFLFTPSVGLCLLLVALVYRLLKLDPAENPIEQWRNADNAKGKRQRALGLLAGIAVLAGTFSVMTFSRNMAWKDNMTLFRTDLPHMPNCSRAHYYLANELARDYDQLPNQAEAKAEIKALYRRAIEITPYAYHAYVALGENLIRFGENEEAIELLRDAVHYYPEEADPHFYLGKALFLTNRHLAAVNALEKSRALDAVPDDTWEMLGRAYGGAKQFAKGRALMAEAIARNPGNARFHDVLSDIEFDAGNVEAAFPPILKMLELEPANAEFWKKLIGRYQLIGDDANAAYFYQQARERGVL